MYSKPNLESNLNCMQFLIPFPLPEIHKDSKSWLLLFLAISQSSSIRKKITSVLCVSITIGSSRNPSPQLPMDYTQKQYNDFGITANDTCPHIPTPNPATSLPLLISDPWDNPELVLLLPPPQQLILVPLYCSGTPCHHNFRTDPWVLYSGIWILLQWAVGRILVKAPSFIWRQ